jgi:hypothetical protein
MRAPPIIGSFVLVASFAAGASIVAACASAPDNTRVTDIYTTDNAYEQFVGNNGGPKPLLSVDQFIELKCGALDCHGQVGRPLRIFSSDGLRLVDDAGATSGDHTPTSTSEQFANYTAAISVQPELTSAVFAGFADPDSLLLLRKPLQAERHKGGQVIVNGDPGYRCIRGWLLGVADFDACNEAITGQPLPKN